MAKAEEGTGGVEVSLPLGKLKFFWRAERERWMDMFILVVSCGRSKGNVHIECPDLSHFYSHPPNFHCLLFRVKL